ncbi:MAG: hypothetical protein E2598_11385 [Sphingobium sp.]|nr:hypothetical protein [Sphingobium sp.]
MEQIANMLFCDNHVGLTGPYRH